MGGPVTAGFLAFRGQPAACFCFLQRTFREVMLLQVRGPGHRATSLPWVQVPTDKGEAGPTDPEHSLGFAAATVCLPRSLGTTPTSSAYLM